MIFYNGNKFEYGILAVLHKDGALWYIPVLAHPAGLWYIGPDSHIQKKFQSEE